MTLNLNKHPNWLSNPTVEMESRVWSLIRPKILDFLSTQQEDVPFTFRGSKPKGGGRLGDDSPRPRADHECENLNFVDLYEVIISPSKEMGEAEEWGFLGKNRRGPPFHRRWLTG